jgi:hypothetical protein
MRGLPVHCQKAPEQVRGSVAQIFNFAIRYQLFPNALQIYQKKLCATAVPHYHTAHHWEE